MMGYLATFRAPSLSPILVLVVLLGFTIPTTLAQTYDILYDSNGNRIQAFGFHFEYNDFNQLVRVRQDNSTGLIIEEYTYNEDGTRFTKHEPQKNQTTYYFDENYIRIVNDSGTFNTVYYYDEKDLVGRRDPDGSKYYYHPDHLGSTTLITNQSGDVVEEITYEPFGKPYSGGTDRFMYTGKELDSGTGLQYYGARYYDPSDTQLFTQPDSILPYPYDPQQLNRNTYVRNNPYKYTDPDGNSIAAAVTVAGFGIGGAALSYFTQASSGKVDMGRVYITGGSFAIAAGTGMVASSAIVGGGISTTILREGTKRIIGTVVGGITQETSLDISLGNTVDKYSGAGSEISTAIRDAVRIINGQEAIGLYIPPGSEVGPVYYTQTGDIIQNPQDIDINNRIDMEQGIILDYLQKLHIDISTIDIHGLIKAYISDNKGLSFEEFATTYSESYQ